MGRGEERRAADAATVAVTWAAPTVGAWLSCVLHRHAGIPSKEHEAAGRFARLEPEGTKEAHRRRVVGVHARDQLDHLLLASDVVEQRGEQRASVPLPALR